MTMDLGMGYQKPPERSEEGVPVDQGVASLGQTINIATRDVHTKLNKLVLARLPLAICPQIDNPSAYVTGLLHITPFYATFESEWQHYIDNPPPGIRQTSLEFQWPQTKYILGAPVPVPDGCAVCPERTRSVLERLRIPGLARTESLKADILALTGWEPSQLEEQLRLVASTGHLAAIVPHIEGVVRKRPHVLLAYAWVLYMALFSGGRFIRATLESAGEEFWRTTSAPVQPTMEECAHKKDGRSESTGLSTSSLLSPAPFGTRACQPSRANRSPTVASRPAASDLPFQFFHFDTPRDGEELKAEFKRRLAEEERKLTAAERADVVGEARAIFAHLLLLTSQLDLVCGTETRSSEGGSAPVPLSPRGFRDSIAVNKGRLRAQREQRGCGAVPVPLLREGGSWESSTSESSSSDCSNGLFVEKTNSNPGAELVGHVKDAVQDSIGDAEARKSEVSPPAPSGHVQWKGHVGADKQEPSSLDGAADFPQREEVVHVLVRSKHGWLGRPLGREALLMLGLVTVAVGFRYSQGW
jgi:heme oxygenase